MKPSPQYDLISCGTVAGSKHSSSYVDAGVGRIIGRESQLAISPKALPPATGSSPMALACSGSRLYGEIVRPAYSLDV